MARVFNAASSEVLQRDQYVVLAYPFTMACWFRANNVLNDYSLMWCGDQHFQDYFVALRLMGSVGGDPVRAFAHSYGGAPGTDTNTTGGYTANKWHHACGVWAARNDRRVYLDGGSKGTGTTQVGVMSGHDRTAVGASRDSTPGEYMDGRIAHAAVWGVALTDSEVAALGKGVNPLSVRRTDILAYWPLYGLPEATNKGLDISGNGKDLGDVNTVTYSFADPPIQPVSYVFGKNNRGLFVPEPFDGTYTSVDVELDTEVVASGNLVPGTYYRVITGPITHGDWTYQVGDTFAAQDGTTTYSGGTVARARTFVSVLEAFSGMPPGPTDEDPTAEAYTGTEDTCHALDVASWYAVMALAMGDTVRAELAMEYVRDHYHTSDPTFPGIKGYPAYLATDPFYLAPSACYADVLPHVWSEGTAGVIIAHAALGDARSMRRDFAGIFGARTDEGYRYTTIANPPVEMQNWPDLASTAWMVLVSGPSGFWDTVITSLTGLENSVYFHDYRKNPVIRGEGTLRLLPGAVSNFTASYAAADLNQAGNWIKVASDQRDFFPIGRQFALSGNSNPTNNGTYQVGTVELDGSGDTQINVDASVKSVAVDGGGGTLALDDDAEGMVIQRLERSYYDELYTPNQVFEIEDMRLRAPDLDTLAIAVQPVGTAAGEAYADTDTRYYRFSYVYDGIQESLLSDTLRVQLEANGMPRFRWTFDATLQNNRITGLNVYRSESAAGPFTLLTTIDYLRVAGNREQPDGAYSGVNRMYIPGLSTYSFDTGSDYMIYVRTGPGSWSGQTIDPLAGGTGFTFFDSVSPIGWPGDIWNGGWELTDGGVTVAKGAKGAYGGENALILTEDLGQQSLGGGVIEVDDLATGPVSTIAVSPADSTWTRFTTPVLHGLAVGDYIYQEGFTDDQYNGYFPVKGINGAFDYDLEIPFITGATTADGTWVAGSEMRLVDDSFEYALHTQLPLAKQNTGGAKVEDKGYRWSSRIDGTYWYEKAGNNVTITYFDPAISAGAQHPLENTPSIDVHGRFGVVAGRRLLQAYLVLDPHGNPETRGNFLSYSELDQLDVTPVGNLIDLSTVGVGEPTGMAKLLRFAVVAKEQGVLLVDTESNPTDPTAWVMLESIHKIGNLAPDGMISAGSTVYLCSHDGIYGLTPNNFAEADKTPTEALRITEPINDIYEALDITQKCNILSAYNSRTFEIFFRLGATTYAYSTTDHEWREVTLSGQADVMGEDEEAHALIYSRDADELASGRYDEASASAAQTKLFVTSPHRGEPVEKVIITYMSQVALTLNLYFEDSTTPAVTRTLPIKTVPGVHTEVVNARAQRFSVEITSPDSAGDIKIDRIRIEHDGE